MRLWTNSANPLGYHLRVTRVSPPQHNFKATEKITGSPSIFNNPVLDDGLYFQMSFNPGNGINYNLAHYSSSLLAQ